MKVYEIRSGSFQARAEGETAFAAIKAALNTKQAKTLGLLASALEVGEEEIKTEFASTERVLRELGLWRD